MRNVVNYQLVEAGTNGLLETTPRLGGGDDVAVDIADVRYDSASHTASVAGDSATLGVDYAGRLQAPMNSTSAPRDRSSPLASGVSSTVVQIVATTCCSIPTSIATAPWAPVPPATGDRSAADADNAFFAGRRPAAEGFSSLTSSDNSASTCRQAREPSSCAARCGW